MVVRSNGELVAWNSSGESESPRTNECASFNEVLSWLTDISVENTGGCVRMISISALEVDDTPRSSGLDHAHVRRLTEAEWPLPPIFVHRGTMRVIDGHHRVAAATLQGFKEIAGNLLDGPIESMLIVAVAANIAHGLPLSLRDRRNGASRIVRSHPDWSDRAVAVATGLSAKTVRALRCASEDITQLHTRLGRDGRRRPMSTAAGRKLAAQLMLQRPDASLREIASLAGISPGTVRNVRARITRGADPVPERGSRLHRGDGLLSDSTATEPTGPDRSSSVTDPDDSRALLSTLSKDPALRMNDRRRELLRWLHLHAVDPGDGAKLVDLAPDHCLERLLEFAERCAINWALIARALQGRSDMALAEQTCHHLPSAASS
jgi:ParB-like chromosome segregation protein Spo0J